MIRLHLKAIYKQSFTKMAWFSCDYGAPFHYIVTVTCYVIGECTKIVER